MQEQFLKVLEGRFNLQINSLNLNAVQSSVVKTHFRFMMDALCVKQSVEENEIPEFVKFVIKLYRVNREFVEEQIKDRDILKKSTHIIDVVYQLVLTN